MPEVAGQHFSYDAEGVAAAEAAAQKQGVEPEMTDESAIALILSEVPPEGEAEEEPQVEGSSEDIPAVMPSAEVLVDLFSAVYGEVFDSESEGAQKQMKDIELALAEQPEIAAALANGEVSISEAALILFRKLEV